jgi:hypothetical protein
MTKITKVRTCVHVRKPFQGPSQYRLPRVTTHITKTPSERHVRSSLSVEDILGVPIRKCVHVRNVRKIPSSFRDVLR